MRVELPFQPAWRPAVLEGRKTTTCRAKRYGRAGDEFELDGATFRLIEVAQMPLARARDELFGDEGFGSPADFEQAWRERHPHRGFDPRQQVWAHRFARVDRSPDGRDHPSG